jgi:hypothetical protein
MNTVLTSPKNKFIKASLLTLFLFLYEIVPFDGVVINFGAINYLTIVSYFLTVLLAGLFISRVKNIYLFTVVLFSVLWGLVLSFGSSSETIINILLASQYESWSGFIKLGKKFEFAEYMLPVYLFIILIFSILLLKKNKISSAS